MRLNVPQTAAVHPDTRRSDFVRQVAALFDSFRQSAPTLKCPPEKFHFYSMPWDLKESVVERHFLTQRTFTKATHLAMAVFVCSRIFMACPRPMPPARYGTTQPT